MKAPETYSVYAFVEQFARLLSESKTKCKHNKSICIATKKTNHFLKLLFVQIKALEGLSGAEMLQQLHTPH